MRKLAKVDIYIHRFILKTLLQCESLWHLDFMCYEAKAVSFYGLKYVRRVVRATNSEQKGGHLQLTPPMILIPDAPNSIF